MYPCDIHYFDYAATTKMCAQSIDSYVKFNTEIGILWGKGNNSLSKESKRIFLDSLDILYKHFNISSEYGFIVGKNVTELFNIIAMSLTDYLSPTDIILVGPYEHHSNYLPWKYLAKNTDSIFLEIPINNKGEVDYDYLIKIANKIKVLSVSTVSNTNAYQIDIEKLLQYINSDTLVFTDESQKVAHAPIIVNDNISGYVVSSHKMYGPKNIAGAFIKQSIIDKMNPILLGGGMIDYQGIDDVWLSSQWKFYAGTYDVGLIYSWSKACQYLSEIGYDVIQKKEQYFFNIIYDELSKNTEINIVNNNSSAKSIISFTHNKIHPHDLECSFASRNIIIRSGNLCAQPAMRKFGVSAINRISFGIYVSDSDIDELIGAIDYYL